ncbi:MAG TPA: hypothetical protein VHG93_27820 [Longimicrobium sp.]|nr:hypothetical protein [Longimicrobium sp.]
MTDRIAEIVAAARANGLSLVPRRTELDESVADFLAARAEFALLSGEDGPRQLAQYLVDATAGEAGNA